MAPDSALRAGLVGQSANQMAQIRARALTPDFLEWLGQFLGDWRLGGGTYQVRRRPDGWLEVLTFDGPDRPLAAVLRGEHVKTVAGPLGPYPVVLTQSLIERWLTSEDREQLRGAIHVTAGRAKLLERIEQRMREKGPDAVRAAAMVPADGNNPVTINGNAGYRPLAG